jgi:hypothetical protein
MKIRKLSTPDLEITEVEGTDPGLTVAGRVIQEPQTIRAMEVKTKDGETRSTPISYSIDEYRENVTNLLGDFPA